ncbi:Protein of unknown function [Lutibacter oricola]|uniref:DUF2958 domain-containing protein n=1 Tax=Lutibacter oricola TaxID=762486 RepID=A0A1H2WM91_9FLAO|nr:DUF2958 domain-containing protein [Lutibacter oricola]SDW81647.1 Protein of unknown function [Lutibacter oricola]
MKLITQHLTNRFDQIGNQSEIENPLIIAKFFNPGGAGTWYATEYNPETKICYGYVTGLAYDEWGTFSIDELETVQLPFGLSIERDIHFDEIHFKELMQKKRLNELPKKDLQQDKNQGLERS